MLMNRAPFRSRQRGLGLPEMLVGLAVGLFVVAGGLTLFSGFVNADRRLIVETRLMQDLRAASDVITRDIRRGGYWGNAHTQVWTTGAATTPRNDQYTLVSYDNCSAAAPNTSASQPSGSRSAACYWIDADGNGSADNAERHGFDVSNGVLRLVVANGTATPLTDPNTVVITGMSIDWSGTQTIALTGTQACAKSCTSNCPTIVVREARVTLSGKAPGDPVAQAPRTLTSNVRVRNDYFTGQCPT